MKKIIAGLIFVKLIFLTVLLMLIFSSCQTAKLSELDTAPMPTPPVVQNDNINRPRSEPYTGDLSIFEDANRAENLQIDRVMEILKISKGKSVADIGAGSGWFSVRAAKKSRRNRQSLRRRNQSGIYQSHQRTRQKRKNSPTSKQF